jgi:hypothetical protein
MIKKIYTCSFIAKLRIYRKYNFYKFKKLMNMPNLKRKEIYPIPENVFLNLNFEDRYSVNWKHRKQHLDILTCNKRNKKIKHIISYFKDKNNYEKTLLNIIESENMNLFEEPISQNKKFWSQGNNYFIYPLIFGFKKKVVPYKKANEYISKNKHNLYSKKYYENLEDMTDEEIKSFLINNPIEITNNCITSGRHRVCAMMNRLINDEKYITFYADIG